MKPATLLLLSLFAPLAFSQQQVKMVGSAANGSSSSTTFPNTPETYRVEVVRRVFALGSPVVSGTTQLHRMGDEAAVAMIKILGTRPPLTDAEAGTVLEIVQKAFEKPVAILNGSNTSVGATLFLLQYLDSITQDEAIKQRISEIRQKLSSLGAAQIR